MNVETRLKQALQEQMPLGQLAYEKVSGQTVDLLTEYFMLLGFKIPDMQELTLLARKVGGGRLRSRIRKRSVGTRRISF